MIIENEVIHNKKVTNIKNKIISAALVFPLTFSNLSSSRAAGDEKYGTSKSTSTCAEVSSESERQRCELETKKEIKNFTKIKTLRNHVRGFILCQKD